MCESLQKSTVFVVYAQKCANLSFLARARLSSARTYRTEIGVALSSQFYSVVLDSVELARAQFFSRYSVYSASAGPFHVAE